MSDERVLAVIVSPRHFKWHQLVHTLREIMALHIYFVLLFWHKVRKRGVAMTLLLKVMIADVNIGMSWVN